MATVSGKQFFGGKPGTVVQSAAPPVVVPPVQPAGPTYLDQLKSAPGKLVEAYKSAGQGIQNAVEGGANQIGQGAYDISKGNILKGLGNIGRGALQSGLGAAGNLASAVFAPIGVAASSLIPNTGNEYIDSAAQGAGAGAALGGPVGAVIGGGLGLAFHAVDAGEKKLLENPKIAQFLQENPDIVPTFNSALNVVAAAFGEKKLTEGAKPDILNAPIQDVPGMVGDNLKSFVPKSKPVNSFEPTSIPPEVKTLADLKTNNNFAESDTLAGRLYRQAKTAQEKSAALSAEVPEVKNAVKVGIDEANAKKITRMSPEDKQTALKMLDAYEQDVKNPGQNSKLKIAGQTVVDQAKLISSKLAQDGKTLGNDIVNKFPNQTITPNVTLDAFNQDLRNLGIKEVVNPDTGKTELNFDNSALKGITGARQRKFLQQVNDDLTGIKTPKDYNTMRQGIFNDLELAKQNKIISKQAEVVIKRVYDNLRIDIADQVGGDLGKGYLEYTQKVAEAEGALRDYYALLGKKFQAVDQYGGDTSLRAGEVSNRILGNAAADSIRVLNQLREAAIKRGYNPNISAVDQILFNNLLEEVLGSNQSRSLGGQVKNAALEAGGEIAQGVQQGLKGNVAGVLKKGVDFFTKSTVEERIRAIRKLLQSGNSSSDNLPPGQTDFGPGQTLPKADAGPAAKPSSPLSPTDQGQPQSSLQQGRGVASAYDSLAQGQPKITSIFDFERETGLSPENRQTETKAFEKILANEDSILADYKAKYGNVVSNDNFKPYFKDVGYQGSNSAAVQKPASYLAKRYLAEALQNKGDYFSMTAGGSGAGKTSAIKNSSQAESIIKDSAAVYDSNLSSVSSALKKIKQAELAGKKTKIFFVYREPLDAFENGVVKRGLRNPEEMGRLVPNKETAKNTVESWDVVKKLEDLGYEIYYFDNNFGNGNAKQVSFEDLKSKIKYPSIQELTKQMNLRSKQLLDEGVISEAQYKGLTE